MGEQFFRKTAKVCADKANAASDRWEREQWLRLAGEWLKLANLEAIKAERWQGTTKARTLADQNHAASGGMSARRSSA
ncbi:MAG: hypothetical protein JOZ70_12645 [Pseudolabrys sp.]|nr:hypothetical protein [Pseudolabrys sp.]